MISKLENKIEIEQKNVNEMTMKFSKLEMMLSKLN